MRTELAATFKNWRHEHECEVCGKIEACEDHNCLTGDRTWLCVGCPGKPKPKPKWKPKPKPEPEPEPKWKPEPADADGFLSADMRVRWKQLPRDSKGHFIKIHGVVGRRRKKKDGGTMNTVGKT